VETSLITIIFLLVWQNARLGLGVDLKPVIVYIHGGGLLGGSARDQSWHLVKKGVVVVSIQVRTTTASFNALGCFAEEGDCCLTM